MEITGKVIQLLPLQEGQGKNGPWKKQEFILETQEQYPKKVCISAWGDKVDQFNLQENAEVTVSINVESREYNGRWYTDIRAWRVTAPTAAAPSGGTVPPPPAEAPAGLGEDEGDDLPF